jgi:hypothetical protein
MSTSSRANDSTSLYLLTTVIKIEKADKITDSQEHEHEGMASRSASLGPRGIFNMPSTRIGVDNLILNIK